MNLTDEKLVDRCRQELPYVTTAFEALLRRYEHLVFRTCQRYLRNEQEAEEACQDAFLRVFHALPRFKSRSSFRTWLFRIVANVCATRYAKLKKAAGQLSDYYEEAITDPPCGGVPGPADLEEISGVIGDGLDMLAPNDRQVLVLRHISGLSLDELSEALNLGLSATKMRLYRAELRLKMAYQVAVQDGEK
jgi:RNA polymerase sigma-70 factor (ECF subfamily)